MLLLHQVGSVKIGEVVRYTVTYVPCQDRILPSPTKLYLRIRNTSALVLRGAFVHGPYTLSVAAYPATFDPNEKFANPRRYGVPEFEPMVKAASYWECELLVPDNIRHEAGAGHKACQPGKNPEHGGGESVSWIIEVASQVIFSSSAAVGFEVVLAREKKSLDLSAASVVRSALPGKVSDHQPAPCCHNHLPHHHTGQPKGVFSKAIHLKVEDTGVLWNSPPFPRWNDCRDMPSVLPANTPLPTKKEVEALANGAAQKKQKKIHLVVLTHGLHSNLGADMLYLKESIDAAVEKARGDRKRRRAEERAGSRKKKAKEASRESTSADSPGTSKQPAQDSSNGDANMEESKSDASEVNEGRRDEQEDIKEPRKEEENKEEEEEKEEEDDDDDDDDDDEQVIVRGFSGNATRTEKGIKYLGKRLARYILSMTYPDQPYLPPSSKASWASMWTDGSAESKNGRDSQSQGTTGGQGCPDPPVRPFKITSISFIGHSLGGLIQTYAIAYCQKHSPEIFDLIKPINFIALSTPFLGLGNENPLYVKFALDSGLVGRTGQDLGLTWRAPTLARSGFDALMSNLGDIAHKKMKGERHPESKPLLRILPTGPAHTALKKFRNRTVYSNVVNDGIVPLRTSCLLFLDWQGLGRVEKARREVGLVGTAIGFGWAELTGTGTTRKPQPLSENDSEGAGSVGETTESGATTPLQEHSHIVPQPSRDAMLEDDRQSLMAVSMHRESTEQANGMSMSLGQFGAFFANLFRTNNGSNSDIGSSQHDDTPRSPSQPTKSHSPPRAPTPKQALIYRRSQTIKSESSVSAASSSNRSRVTTGSELEEDGGGSVMAPPTTTLFESAHDLLNPQLPDLQHLLDPAKRPRTIFHDRVYHPEDIPPPPIKRRTTGLSMRKRTATSRTMDSMTSGTSTPASSQPARTLPRYNSSSSSSRSSRSNNSCKEDHPLASKAKTESSSSSAEPTISADKNKEKDKKKEHEKEQPTVDASSMRVEEKIARAYHRDLSWRKVLVKLEPDAHNNIIVRRMFANAFGWPVVRHIVEAHFSDSVTARTRDDEDTGAERALGIEVGPRRFGDETTADKDRKRSKEGNRPGARRTESESREAEDKVSELPGTPTTTANTPTATRARSPWDAASEDGGAARHAEEPRGAVTRADSMTWSERDWADSENDSDAEVEGPAGSGSQHKSGEAGWNWTEKIVGKRAVQRARSNVSEASKK